MSVELNALILSYVFSGLGLMFAGYCLYKISEVKLRVLDPEQDESDSKTLPFTNEQLRYMKYTSNKIADGANIFLLQEYLILLIFIVVFSIAIIFLGEYKLGYFYTTIAFIIGSQTSLLAGFVGMRVATGTNSKTAFQACFGIGQSFKTAYLGGCVLGFFLVSASIIVLLTISEVYKAIRFGENVSLTDWKVVFEGLAGYGLGGSSVALFCRVGGGIYTKAADVGADLVSKLELGLEEDDPRNPACIADNVGDNVGDIAGMGSDLFGSMAESLCAALLVGVTSPQLTSDGGYLYPVMITSSGIVVCIIVTYAGFIAADDIVTYEDLETSVKMQLVVSTVILTPTIMLLTLYYLPENFTLGKPGTISYVANVDRRVMVVCPFSGLISGLLIGISTEYFTSLSAKPVKDLAQGCKEGAAINTILGLALGFLSNIIPTILIALSLFASFKIAGMFGIAISAIGMLANLPICLAIDGYGPISDNAGGLASMCELDPDVRNITDMLDAAGNTTAAIGKGFAIGSACLCAFALYGAFITKSGLSDINLMTPLVMSGILFGAMIPFVFSALTMKAVGSAAEAIVDIIRKDYHENKNNPDHEPDSSACIAVATKDSLTQMILPGVIVIFTPLLLGLIFGCSFIAGYLIGVIVSGIQMAISSSNSGGAWDNTKKLIKNKGLPIKGLERYYYLEKDLEHVINTSDAIKQSLIKLNREREASRNDPERFTELDEEIKHITQYTVSDEERSILIEEQQRCIVKKQEMEELLKSRGGVVPDIEECYGVYKTSITANNGEDRQKEKKEKLLIREFHVEEILKAKFKIECLVNKPMKRRSFRFAEKASITGDTIGDPLKDTSGPSLNILIKLSSIISVVFATFYLNTGYAAKYLVV